MQTQENLPPKPEVEYCPSSPELIYRWIPYGYDATEKARGSPVWTCLYARWVWVRNDWCSECYRVEFGHRDSKQIIDEKLARKLAWDFYHENKQELGLFHLKALSPWSAKELQW